MADFRYSHQEWLILRDKPWLSWTPTIDNDGGSEEPDITFNASRYYRVGNIVYLYVNHTVDSSNGATGAYTITLPIAPAVPAGQIILWGREGNVTGKSLFGYWTGSVCRIAAHNSINNGVFTDNYNLNLAGAYRV